MVLGTGPQAIWQIRSHLALMPGLRDISLWGRNPARAQRVIAELAPDAKVAFANDLTAAASAADVIVTATCASEPLIHSSWIRDGTHITAVGADAPGKQELDVDLVARAGRIAVDRLAQCIDHGEISHALQQGRISETDLVELGTLLADMSERVSHGDGASASTGRKSDDQITLANLTGIAAQDIAMANAVIAAADRRG